MLQQTHVVRDRVPEHVVERVLLADVLRLPANDDRELDLPVDLVVLSHQRDLDDGARVGDRRRRLQELDGQGWVR